MLIARVDTSNQWPAETFHVAVKFAESMKYLVPGETITRDQIIQQMLEFMAPAGNV